MTDQDRLEDLLDRWEESRGHGQELSASELCHDCPELAEELVAQIRLLKRSDWMLEVQHEADLDFLPLPPIESLSAHTLVPASLSLDQFTTNITTSGVMTGDELIRFDASDAQDLAAHLLRSKQLTKYQAKLIAEGDTDGLVLGNYVLLDRIGAGGMGQVFKARHRRMERIVALKVLPKEAVDSPTAVERFHQEVKAAAKLEHSNIVTAFDADESNGTHFLVMQFVDGQDLASLVRNRGPMSVARAADCVVQAAKGLEYAHGVGIVHRDIKPANLLLDNKGTVKILDMGLARLETNSDSGGAVTQAQLTQDGAVMGTVDFMSPEQAVDTHKADARSDIYSLGCTLFYLLTGKPAYQGPTLLARMMAHKEAGIPRLQDERDGLPPKLSAVFQKMVAKQPDDRYQTAAALLADLEKVADELVDDEAVSDTVSLQETAFDMQSKETSPASLNQTLDLQAAAKPAATETATPAPKTGWYKLIVGGAAVLALAIFGWLYLAGIIFKVETPDGIIQIETNVPDIEVLVDNKKVVSLSDPNDQKKIRVQVKPGAKTLTVSKDGFEAEVTEFNLKTVKGPIKVTFVAVEEEMPTTVDGDIDRQIAEWVVGVGGSVTTIEQPFAKIEDRDDLPSKAFGLHAVFLDGYTELDEAALRRLAQLADTEITNLYLTETNVTDSDLEYLTRITPLAGIHLRNTRITDAGLEHLVKLPNLRDLGVESPAITDIGLRHLDERMKNLAYLKLADTKVTKEGVQRLLGELTRIQLIDLGGTVLDLDHESLSALQKVRPECQFWLKPHHSECDNAYWVLRLGGIPEIVVGDEKPFVMTDVETVPRREPGFPIVSINFNDNQFLNDACAKRFKDIVGLKRLSLRNTGLTDAAIDDLKSLKDLDEMDLAGTKTTAEGIEAIRKALPNCKVVWEGEGGPESK